MPELRIRYRGIVYIPPKGSLLLGRARTCGVVAMSHLVSRHHATIRNRDDRLYVSDLGSKNGTWVNGERISEVTQLCDGDRLRLGDQEMSIFASDPLADTARTHPLPETFNDPETTLTQDQASTLDMMEILIETRTSNSLRGRTTRSVVAAVDDLLDRAGLSRPRLAGADAERVRRVADRLMEAYADDTLRHWRRGLDQRLLSAMEHGEGGE